MDTSPCPGCGVELATIVGPTHPYIESSPACWAVYGEVLAREYSDPEYMRVHRLTVDAYAVQHPGLPSRRSTQSVGGHLIALQAVLELGVPMQAATQRLGRAVAMGGFTWLEPPAVRGELNVVDVARAQTAAEHQELVWAWARSVWAAWTHHHPRIRQG